MDTRIRMIMDMHTCMEQMGKRIYTRLSPIRIRMMACISIRTRLRR